jgi:hypothetical protein
VARRRTARIVLALRVLRHYAVVRRELWRRRPLATIVAGAPRATSPYRDNPLRLSRAVSRVLLHGHESQVRCIHRALVLHRLLVEQGTSAVVVIGLPPEAPGVRTHAWVEVGGHDVGPLPGRAGHEPMATYR